MSPPRDHQNSDSPSTLRQLRSILATPAESRTNVPRTSDGSGPATRDPGIGAVLTADDLLALAEYDEDSTTAFVELGLLEADFDTRTPIVRPAIVDLNTVARFDTTVTRPRNRTDRRATKRDGVAPFVPPSARRSTRKRRRDYRKLGFVELTQERARLRHRILPRTVLGVSSMMLALGVGAAFAGAALYAFYDYRLTQNESRIGTVITDAGTQFSSAVQEVQKVRDDAITSINQTLTPLQTSIEDINATVSLREKVGRSTFTIRTTDTAGRPTIGSAFVVPSPSDTESWLITAYEVVAASTANPGPPIILEKGGEQFRAELWAWDVNRDLALLKVAKGGMTPLTWASETTRAAAGNKRVYAVSGLGGAGATVADGQAQDQSQAGLRHDIPIAIDFRGGPIVLSSGEVMAITTNTYRPLGFDSPAMPYAPPIVSACEQILVCPEAVKSGAASPGQQPLTTPSAGRGASAEGSTSTTTAKK